MPPTFPKSGCVYLASLWLGLFGRQQNRSWVLTFDFVIGGVAIGPFREERQCKKIRLGGPKSGRTCPFSSKQRKCGSFLWRFLQREKEKRSKSVRRQAKIGAGYLSSPPRNWLSLQKLHEDRNKVFEIDWIFVLVGCLGWEKPCKALMWEVKVREGRGGRKQAWAVVRRLRMSGWNGPTTTITKRTAAAKPHLSKNRTSACQISKNKSVYFFVFWETLVWVKNQKMTNSISNSRQGIFPK